MKTIFLAMMIAMMLWNEPNTVPSAQKEIFSGYRSHGREYTPEGLGFLSGTRIEAIRGWYINGHHIIPKEITHRGTIVIFGGSEGSNGIGSAISLVNEGYEVYCMYFFGQENQQREMNRIPLEFFAELYLHIQKTARSPRPLTVEGTSKGTELALLLASYYPEYVDHLVLYAPLNYVFQGHGRERHSAWTFRGRELPFIRTDAKEGKVQQMIDMRNKKPTRGIESYRYGLEHDENKDKARIDLAPVRAKMLIFAGELDMACPAADMGREIKANYRGECELVIFEKAGHGFYEITTFLGQDMGGEPEANVQAGIESNRIRLEKLAEWTR